MSIHKDREELLAGERGLYTGAEHVPYNETKNPERAVENMPRLRANMERHPSIS